MEGVNVNIETPPPHTAILFLMSPNDFENKMAMQGGKPKTKT